MQFFSGISKLVCWIRDADGEKRDLENRLTHEILPQYQALHKEFAIAEIKCEFDIDVADCDRMNKLRDELHRKEQQITDVREEIASLDRECG